MFSSVCFTLFLCVLLIKNIRVLCESVHEIRIFQILITKKISLIVMSEMLDLLNQLSTISEELFKEIDGISNDELKYFLFRFYTYITIIARITLRTRRELTSKWYD